MSHTLTHAHTASAPQPCLPGTFYPAILLPVVVAVDGRLAGEAQHSAHHPGVVPGPALVTHLPPVTLIPHFHSSLGHRAPPLGTGKDGLEPHLLQLPALQGARSPWALGFLPLLSPPWVLMW